MLPQRSKRSHVIAALFKPHTTYSAEAEMSDCGSSECFLRNPTEMETELFLFPSEVALGFPK